MARPTQAEMHRVKDEVNDLIPRLVRVNNTLALPSSEEVERPVFLELQRRAEAEGGRWVNKEKIFLFVTMPSWAPAATIGHSILDETPMEPLIDRGPNQRTETEYQGINRPARAAAIGETTTYDGIEAYTTRGLDGNEKLTLAQLWEKMDRDLPVPEPSEYTGTIGIDNVVPDPAQPRKHFDAGYIEELAGSIKDHGILQRIMVRCNPDKHPDAPDFMIIFGECRWRAGKLAGLTDIEVDVRDVSEETVREMQMIENLHRADLHPMQEGLYFREWIDAKEGRTHHDLAARINKNEKYVRVRLKLCSLTPEWQQLVMQDNLTFHDAMKLATVSTEIQQECLQQYIPKNMLLVPGTILNLNNLDWFVNQRTHLLKDAPFSTTDPTLNPERGACTTCQYNTAVKELFNDHPATCTLASCFRIKSIKEFEKELHQRKQEGLLFIEPQEYLTDGEKFWLNLAKEHVTALKHGSYITKRDYPRGPGTYEEFVDNFRTWPETIDEVADGSWDGGDEALADEDTRPWSKERIEELEASLEAEYRKAVDEWMEKVTEWQATHKDAIMAMVICGRDIGKYVAIELTKTAAEIMGEGATDQEQPGSNLTAEILNMTQRAARADELADEKLWLEIRKVATGYWDGNKHHKGNEPQLKEPPLNDLEIGAMNLFLYHKMGMDYQRDAGKQLANHFKLQELESISDTRDAMDQLLLTQPFTHPGMNVFFFLMRHYMIRESFPASKSHKTGDVQKAGYQFIQTRCTSAVNELELEFDHKAIKRRNSLEARIAAAKRHQETNNPAVKEETVNEPDNDE